MQEDGGNEISIFYLIYHDSKQTKVIYITCVIRFADKQLIFFLDKQT